MNGKNKTGKIVGITLVTILVTAGIASAVGNSGIDKQVSFFFKAVLRGDVNRTVSPENENMTKPLENVSGNETGSHENETEPLGNETGNETGNCENNTGISGNETRPLGNMTHNETGLPGNENMSRPFENMTGNETGKMTYHPADTDRDYRISLSELTSYVSRYGENDPYVQSASDIWRHAESYFWDSESQSWSPV